MRLKDFLTLQKLQQAEGDLDQEVAGLVYDSRRVTKGDVFFAVPGEQADGHQFVNQAMERGAIAVVVADKAKVPPGVTFVRVHDVRAAMGLWAAHFYGQPLMDFIIKVSTTGPAPPSAVYPVSSHRLLCPCR